MYSRSYYPDDSGRLALPDNYDGTAFIEQAPQMPEQVNIPEEHEENSIEAGSNALSGGTLKIPLLSELFGIEGGLRLPTLGIEEILILATAAFLFFSKDGDKESAIILLLLLLIN